MKKYNRRNFLVTGGKGIGLMSLLPFGVKHLPFPTPDEGDDFWEAIRASYEIPHDLINLNNAGVSPQPLPVKRNFFKLHNKANLAPSYYMWRKIDKRRPEVRERLADLLGAKPTEIALNRNATEALNTLIWGVPLEKKDEVVIGNYDYPHMRHAFKQRELMQGIKVKEAILDLPSQSDDAMVKSYTDQFTSRTKLVHITHLVNWNGQVVPVKKIAAEAKKRNIEVMVDAAQSFAHLDFNISDWNIDYLGTSLHKWLGAPLGTGMLYIREELIEKIRVPFPGEDPDEKKITKFEHIGTRNNAAEMAILAALDFHHTIGSKEKHERLFELKQYWTSKAKQIQGFTTCTPETIAYSSAICTFSLEGKKPGDISGALQRDHGIHTTTMKWENAVGVRVSPNVYTTKQDLDKLVNAIDTISKS